jgi:phosphoglycerol transferase MdoB-like AlkP superfamily enzyme
MMMVRKIAVLVSIVVVLVAAAVWLRQQSREGDSRPHVVLIVIDTLRADRLGCYGYERDVSPELDALARDGVRFARTVAQCSWTRPSIGSMLTSLYPRSLGIHFEDRGDLPDPVATLAEILHDTGYRTFGATANPHLNPSFNFHQGFDFYLDSVNVFDWMPATLGQLPQAHPPLPSARDLFTRVLASLDHEDRTDRLVPHYLQFVIMEVHETWGENDLVRAEFKGLYPDIAYTKERRYLQAVRQVSADIDWFLRELENRPGWDDILLVLVSDHGEGLASHPDVPGGEVHGFLLYESQVMVPWILYSSAGSLPAGREVVEPVRLLDLMPTVLDLLHVEPPQGLMGTSLVPFISGGDVALPEHFFVETYFRGANKLGVYSDEWKLFHNRDLYPNLNAVELQRMGIRENGVLTDEGLRFPDVVRNLGASLRVWEISNPPADPVELGDELSQETIEQLRSLGYLE